MDSYIEKAAQTLYSYRPNKRVVANSHAVARSAGIPLHQEIGFTPRDVQISLEALQFFQAEGILKYKQEIDDTAKYTLDFSLMFKINIVHTIIEDIDYEKLEGFLPQLPTSPSDAMSDTSFKDKKTNLRLQLSEDLWLVDEQYIENIKTNKTHYLQEHYVCFLGMLANEPWKILFHKDTIPLIERKTGYKIGRITDFKTNLIKQLRNKWILGKSEDFIIWEKNGYRIGVLK